MKPIKLYRHKTKKLRNFKGQENFEHFTAFIAQVSPFYSLLKKYKQNPRMTSPDAIVSTRQYLLLETMIIRACLLVKKLFIDRKKSTYNKTNTFPTSPHDNKY